MSRDLDTIRNKTWKLPGGEEFIETVDSLSTEQLEARITQMQKDLEESEIHREENTVLNDLKEQVSMISGPYNDVKKAVKTKTSYIIALIKERGGQ